jgi:hypothetical protein
MQALTFSAVESLETDRLVQELKNGILSTIQSFIWLSKIWAELERRGYDLEPLRKGIARTLPLIASGRLSAEAVVAFMDKPAIIHRLENMPIEQQKRIANGELVTVYIPGESECKQVSLVNLPHSIAARVITPEGNIRTPSEQRLLANAAKEKEKKKREPTVKVKDRRLYMGKRSVSVDAVIAAVVDAAGGNVEVIESKDRQAMVIAGKVTDEEKERIKAICKAKNITESEAVRMAVIAMWLS